MPGNRPNKFSLKNHLKLLNLGPTFIMTQNFYDKLLLDIETNSCRTAYQLKWYSKVQDEFNKTTTNTNTFPIYTLDHPINPLANKELDFNLWRLKRSIFSILRKHKRLPHNLSSTQWGNL